jgi:hypothetical protein
MSRAALGSSLVCLLWACSQGHSLPGDDERAQRSSDGESEDGGQHSVADAHAPHTSSALTYYRDVKPIIDEKCTSCHVDGGIAPVPFTEYGAIKDFVKLIRREVSADRMPPWRAAAPLDYFVGDRRLAPEQKDTILRWIDGGAAEGNAKDEPKHARMLPRGLPHVDLSLEVSEPFTPDVDPDTYRCFVLEWPYAQTKYITGLGIEPQNKKIVHHAIAYLIEPENVDAVREQDAADPAPGYSCFGSTGSSAWLTSYEPGGFGQEIPGKLGFEVRPGSAVVLQIHYNTLNGKAPDQSRVDFTVADHVDRVGDVVLIMNPTWPAGSMPIPAGDTDVVHAYVSQPLELDPEQRYQIYWADLHMHTLGSRGGIGIVRAAHPEKVEPLLQIPNWAFEWQETYILSEPVDFLPGDQLAVECHFDNSDEHQLVINGQRLPTRDVNWGEGTTDEMCLGNVLVAPAQ